MTWREDLRAIVESVAQEQIPDLVGELARADLIARARIASGPNGAKASPAPDCHLTAAEVAKLLGVKPTWCYEHASELGAVQLRLGFGPLFFGRDAPRKRDDAVGG